MSICQMWTLSTISEEEKDCMLYYVFPPPKKSSNIRKIDYEKQTVNN